MKNNRRKDITERKGSPEQLTGAEGSPNHAIVAAFLLCTAFLAYAVSLNGTWAFDDTAITQYTSIENSLNLSLGYRKIAYLSFLLNKWINPVSPVNFRVMNILIHAVNSFLVYVVAFRTLRLPRWTDEYGRYSFPVALLSSSIFALHPLNINAVAYVVQRMTSLAAMFVLLSLLSYIIARTSSGRIRPLIFYVLALISIILGIFSKENAVLAVPLLILYEAVFLGAPEKRVINARTLTAAAAALLLLGAVSVILEFQKTLLGLAGIFLHPMSPIAPANWTAVDVSWTPLQHIMTEFRVIARYLILVAAPLPRLLVFDWWGFPVSKGLLDPLSTLGSMLVIFSIVGFSVWKRRKLPFLFFGALWYFLAISLESFAAVGSDLYFEHRNYLPLAGLIFGLCAQAAALLGGKLPKRKTVWAVVCVFSIVLGGLTLQRNLIWRDSVTLWQDTVDKTSGNIRAAIALGNSFLRVSDLNSARMQYRDAVRVSASLKSTRYLHDSIYSLGMVDLFMGDLEDARKVIAVMERKLEGTYATGILKGFYLSLSGDPAAAVAQFEGLLPSVEGLDKVIVYTLMGEAYARNGQQSSAIGCYQKAINMDPSFSAAYYEMGSTYLSMKDVKTAEYYIRKSLVLEPDNALALAEMADIQLLKKGPPEKALLFASKAVSNSPVFSSPYLTMGTVLTVMGKGDEAETYFRRAKERGAKDYLIPYSKARAYYLIGDTEKLSGSLREVLAAGDIPEDLKRTIGSGMGGL